MSISIDIYVYLQIDVCVGVRETLLGSLLPLPHRKL